MKTLSALVVRFRELLSYDSRREWIRWAEDQLELESDELFGTTADVSEQHSAPFNPLPLNGDLMEIPNEAEAESTELWLKPDDSAVPRSTAPRPVDASPQGEESNEGPAVIRIGPSH